jgi:hypothetical protein
MTQDTESEQNQSPNDNATQDQDTNIPTGNTGTRDSVPPTGIRGTFDVGEKEIITTIQKNEK